MKIGKALDLIPNDWRLGALLFSGDTGLLGGRRYLRFFYLLEVCFKVFRNILSG